MDVVRQAVWYTLVSIFAVYGFFLIVGTYSRTKMVTRQEPMHVRDSYSVETRAHTLSGYVMVPTACDQLTVSTQEVAPATYMLKFSTWRETSVDCKKDEPVSRSFRAVVAAPAVGSHFVATLNGTSLPIVVYFETQKAQ